MEMSGKKVLKMMIGAASGGWVVWCGLLLFALFAILLFAIAVFDRSTDIREKPYNASSASSERRALEERFARGGMDEVEYLLERVKLTER